MHLDFGEKLKVKPLIFSVNYFLKDKQGKFLNDVEDKHIWLKWMGLRVEGKVSALATPTGFIPKYEDLKILFKEVLGKEYLPDAYVEQFTLRVGENLARIERIVNIYKRLRDIPSVLFEELQAQKERLMRCQKDKGDYVSPFAFKGEGK
jgi:phosphoenolpyruvate carboxykinase (GTP)